MSAKKHPENHLKTTTSLLDHRDLSLHRNITVRLKRCACPYTMCGIYYNSLFYLRCIILLNYSLYGTSDRLL